MRVANKSIYDSVRWNLDKITRDMSEANTMVSSMKTLQDLSDDPVAMVTVLDIRSSISNIGQLEENITMGKPWLNMGESALTQIEEVLGEAKTLCIQMASGTVGGSERADAVTHVDGYLRQILSLANTGIGDRYIFSGTKTDTPPFAFDDDTNPTQVTYSGNGTAFAVKIGKSNSVEVGRDGETVFGDDNITWSDPAAGQDNIFKTLIDLKTHLLNNDAEEISATLDKLDNHLDTVSNMISDTGGKIIRMEVKETIIKDLNLNHSERKSQLEDADMAEAVMNLKTKEIAYQAALSSSAKVMSLSLVNYL
ncbi:MAG: flagellar hook-associated protein FlgL [Deltaproteobacteria bacterium]|nr:flagellar hook-associated protein FlgL [Deltaproteobacteria bacterium]